MTKNNSLFDNSHYNPLILIKRNSYNFPAWRENTRSNPTLPIDTLNDIILVIFVFHSNYSRIIVPTYMRCLSKRDGQRVWRNGEKKRERDGRKGRGICTRPREKQSFPRVCIKLDGAFNFVESVPRPWRSGWWWLFFLFPLCGTALHQQPGWHQCPRSKTWVKRCYSTLP